MELTHIMNTNRWYLAIALYIERAMHVLLGATWVGHYPWFFTNNQLRTSMPEFDFKFGKYARNAVISHCARALVKLLEVCTPASVVRAP
eukprot:2578424-Amphidinium_carterae.2